MKRFLAATFVLAIVAAAVQAKAADNPTGTWKWSVPGRNGQTREMTLKLKLEGDKLTGAMLGRGGKENPIQDATYKDGTVSFKVVREWNGNKMTTTFTGKVSGDVIKGKIESDRAGTKSHDWEAKRANS